MTSKARLLASIFSILVLIVSIVGVYATIPFAGPQIALADDCVEGDDDGDGVCNDVDICPGGDDNVDSDSDGIPDFCDDCPNDPDNDAEGDGVCGDVDICPGGDDNVDSDSDGIPDFCDTCPNDPLNDVDGDGIGDVCAASANDFHVLEGTHLTDQIFIDEGIKCAGDCPTIFDYSGIDTQIAGDYTYTIQCDDGCSGISGQGTITVIETHTIAFIANNGGNVNGETLQIVLEDGACSLVRALADPGYRFTYWTIYTIGRNGSFSNLNQAALNIYNITGDIKATANFIATSGGGGGGSGGGGIYVGGGGAAPAPVHTPTPSPTPAPAPAPEPTPAAPPPTLKPVFITPSEIPTPPTEQPATLMTFNLAGKISEDGTLSQDVVVTSVDSSADIQIPAGTTALDADGDPLSQVTIQPLVMHSPIPPEGNIIVMHDFGPDGATFDPSIIVTMSYDPDELPEGIAPGDLVLAYYDPSVEEWVVLDNIAVDEVNHTIVGTTSHFTEFALLTNFMGVDPTPILEPDTSSDDGLSPSEFALINGIIVAGVVTLGTILYFYSKRRKNVTAKHTRRAY